MEQSTNDNNEEDLSNKRKLQQYLQSDQQDHDAEDYISTKKPSLEIDPQASSTIDWTPFQCRQAQEDDINSIIQLIAEILVEYNVCSTLSKAKKSIGKDIRMLQTNYFAKGGTFDVITLENKTDEIVGLISVLPRSHGVVDLKRLYVKKDFRKMGLGQKLVQRALQKAKELEARRVDLVVYKVHTEAIQLYTKHGFKEWQPNGKSPKDIFMRLELTTTTT